VRDEAGRAAATVLAWLLAALNLAAATGKALDLPGFADVLSAYRLFPEALLMPVAVGVTMLEAAIAVGLMVRPTRRVAAWAAGLLALGYGIVLTVTLARGIALENCGCFGVYLARPLGVHSPLEDLALIAAALLVLRFTPRPAR
jgi:hypothetical protein